MGFPTSRVWNSFRQRRHVYLRYIQAIFALKDEYLSALRTTYCTNLSCFSQEIESNWRNIVSDISTGTINTDLDIPCHVRIDLSAVLKPYPIRGEQLRKEFERGFDGIATRVWPYLMHMFAIVPSDFQIDADLLETNTLKVSTFTILLLCSIRFIQISKISQIQCTVGKKGG